MSEVFVVPDRRNKEKYIKTAAVAYWYFRLNGFMTMENFIVHPELERGGPQRTDADLYGVRYPKRSELDMQDDERFTQSDPVPYFSIVEVTRGKCKLNGPWTDKGKRNIDYVINAIGAFDKESLENIADSLYERGGFLGTQFQIRLIAVGAEIDDDLGKRYPEMIQVTLEEMLSFIYRRFRTYQRRKADNQQWNSDGKRLWKVVQDSEIDKFCEQILGLLT